MLINKIQLTNYNIKLFAIKYSYKLNIIHYIAICISSKFYTKHFSET